MSGSMRISRRVLGVLSLLLICTLSSRCVLADDESASSKEEMKDEAISYEVSKWEIPGWEESYTVKDDNPIVSCDVILERQFPKMTMFSGVMAGQKVKHGDESAYSEFLSSTIKKFESGLPAGLKAKQSKTELKGTSYDVITATSNITVAAVFVTKQSDVCVAYWYIGNPQRLPEFRAALGTAVVVKKNRDVLGVHLKGFKDFRQFLQSLKYPARFADHVDTIAFVLMYGPNPSDRLSEETAQLLYEKNEAFRFDLATKQFYLDRVASLKRLKDGSVRLWFSLPFLIESKGSELGCRFDSSSGRDCALITQDGSLRLLSVDEANAAVLLGRDLYRRKTSVTSVENMLDLPEKLKDKLLPNTNTLTLIVRTYFTGLGYDGPRLDRDRKVSYYNEAAIVLHGTDSIDRAYEIGLNGPNEQPPLFVSDRRDTQEFVYGKLIGFDVLDGHGKQLVAIRPPPQEADPETQPSEIDEPKGQPLEETRKSKPVPALHQEVDARSGWQKMLAVKKGEVLYIEATGKWNTWANMPKFDCDADGGFKGLHTYTGDYLEGALLGRVGEKTFLVGKSKKLVIEADGVLEMRSNKADDFLHDNNGELNVTIAK